MCCCEGQPCFGSVFGIPLKKSVFIIGLGQLVITVIATILNIVRYFEAEGLFEDDFELECDEDVCIGPIIKYAVFDGFFGVCCSLMLIFGSHLKNSCLLIFWMIVTVFVSLKYIWVVLTHDWTEIEDWISITFLVFYISVFLIIISFIKEVRGGGVIHGQIVGGTTVVINQAPPAVVINQSVPMQQYPPQGYAPVPQVQQYPPQGYAPVQQVQQYPPQGYAPVPQTYPQQPPAYTK